MRKPHKICAAAIAAATALTLSAPTALIGCGGDKNDPTVLNIVALNAGYGKEWLETLAARFENDHPGYKVDLSNAIYGAGALINSHLASKNNVDDLYICVGTSWKAYAAQNKFASLDDLIEEEVDGVKIKDKVMDEFSSSVYYPDQSGELHSYRLPWTAGSGGIFYNKAMFDANGWSVPATYGELKALCDRIVEDDVPVQSAGSRDESVKPFVYTGQNPDYFDYTVYTWWAQLAGENNIKQFMQYGSADNYKASVSPTYNHLKTATKMWSDLFGNSDYVMPMCTNKSNHDAQTDFNSGKAAMIFGGDWIYNEISDYGIENDGFELALMKTPVADGAADTSITYTIGEDQYIAIPESSVKKDLAKDFIKLMVSDYGCEVFLNQAHGVLAYKTTDISTDDAFLNNLISTKNSYEKAFTNYPSFSADEIARTAKVTDSRKLYLANLVDIWGTAALRPYTSLISSSPTTLDAAFDSIGNEISRQWSDWLNQVR